MYCVYKILYFNTVSISFNTVDEKEMCTDFIIILGIKDLRTFP